MPVTVTGYHHNNYGRKKPIYSCVFYELLPLGTMVNEDSVYIDANGKISRSMYNVEFVSDWKSTGRTMMIVSVGMPETIKDSSIELHYGLINTYENLLARGTNLDIPGAFANTNSVREIYEILPKVKRISEIPNGSLLFGDQEAQYGEYVAYDMETARFLKVNAYSSGFGKLVNTLDVFTDQTDIIANTKYTYRLQYSQSEFAQSDNVIFYDLLDRGTVVRPDTEWDGYVSKWQGTFSDIQIPEIKSSVTGLPVAPVVYYSTINITNIDDLPRDITDTSVWNAEMPADKSEITAIAVDFTKDTEGGSFILKGQDTVIADIIMTSPADEALDNTASVNTGASSARLYAVGANPETGTIINAKSQTLLMMRPVTEEIALTSVPESGTNDEPKLMAYNDTIEYDIAIINPDNDFIYRNIKVEDKIPDEVTPEINNIYVYRNDDKENAVNIGSSTRVAMTKSANNDFGFTAFEVLPGEVLHVVIPGIVNTKEGKFTNIAKLTELNGIPKNKLTETTYHEVKRYDIQFGKKILDSAPVQYLAGATLKLTDSSGTAVDEWVSSAETGQEHHIVRIGAGEYILHETDAPDNYAVAEPVRFTLSREGDITYRGESESLDAQIIEMADKYIAVDTVIENKITNANPDVNKEFTYVARIDGLKGGKVYYTDKGDSFTANRFGAASFTFALKHDETLTLEKLPSGAHIEITQRGSEYFAKYNAVMVRDEDEEIIDSGETYLYKQALVTKETEINIDKGELHFRFENKYAEGIPVRFIVVDDENESVVPGAVLKLTSVVPEGTEPEEIQWTTTDKYKSNNLKYETSYKLNQISAPERYIANDPDITLSVDEEGILTCDNDGYVTTDANGYIVTIRNKSKAVLAVENIAQNTFYHLSGAKFNLMKDGTAEPVQSWTSAEDKGHILYLDRNATYTVIKTKSPDGYSKVPPASVQVNVDADANITVDETAMRAKVYNNTTHVLTFYDKYTETLTITNHVNGTVKPSGFNFEVSGLTQGDEYIYIRDKGKDTEIEGTFTVDENGKITFELADEKSIIIGDLPRNVTVSEVKPAGTFYRTDWVVNKTTTLTTADDIKRSSVAPALSGRNFIDVTNYPCIAIVRNKTDSESEWSEWKGFEHLVQDAQNGAFDYANSITGAIDVATVLETHGEYTMSDGYTFNNAQATRIAIYSYENLTASNKRSTLTKAFGGKSMFAINSAETEISLANIVIDGNSSSHDNQNVNGGIAIVTAGTLSLGENALLQNTGAKNGGAVYVANGSVMKMSVGAIHNAHAVYGGAIYLEEGAKLELSGSPSFENNIGEIPSIVGDARQDIYIAGYLPTEPSGKVIAQNATSLVVTGAINLPEDSIYVYAEKPANNDKTNHYAPLKQFGIFANELIVDGPDGSKNVVLVPSGTNEENATAMETTLNAFTNAFDTQYHAVQGYDGKTIYWDGPPGQSRVILQKTDPSGKNLAGAKFTIMKVTKGRKFLEWTDAEGHSSTEFTSGMNGVFFAGMMDFGVYVLHEVSYPLGHTGGPYYYVVVNENRIVASSPTDGYATEEEAKQAGMAAFAQG